MNSWNQSCKFNISDAAKAISESMLISLSCSSKNFSEENEIDIETERETEGLLTQRTLISGEISQFGSLTFWLELDRAKYPSVDKYKELNCKYKLDGFNISNIAIMKKKNSNQIVKINSECTKELIIS